MKIFTSSKKIFLSVLLLFCLGFAGSDELKFHIVNDNEYNTLFTRYNGWTGGDIAHTVPLTDSITLWLFGDSWIGHVKKNSHSGSKMICNSLAIQYGKSANEKNLKFYYKTIDGKPSPLFAPANGEGQYWLTRGGIKTGNVLYLITSQIVKTDDKSVFGFKSIGNSVLAVGNPFDEPTKWRVEVTKMPFFLSNEDTEIDFGFPEFIKDSYIYIYGVELRKKENER